MSQCSFFKSIYSRGIEILNRSIEIHCNKPLFQQEKCIRIITKIRDLYENVMRYL